MAFCPNCGTQASGRFCPNCGADTGATSASTAGPGVPPPDPSGAAAASFGPPPPPAGSIAQAPGLSDNMAGALCYLFGLITGIIFLILSPYNRNRLVRFHAFQSIFATLALIVIEIVLGIFTAVLWSVHLGVLVTVFWLVFRLAVFLGWLYMMYMTYTNKKVVLPLVGPLAEKQA